MSDRNPYMPEDVTPEAATDAASSGSTGAGCSPNGITLIFIVLTGLFIVYFAILMVNPYVPINPFPPRTPLPIYVVATADPFAIRDTPTPTKLPETPRLSAPLPSPTATIAPSDTAVVVTPPPLLTDTPLPPTATLIGGAEGAEVVEGAYTPPPPVDPALVTRSPLPFTVADEQVTYMANPNVQGCRWASIAGSALDLSGNPISGLAVRVRGEGIDEIRFTGTALTYSTGGYEIFLNGAPLQAEYIVQLLSRTGSPISEEFTVITSPLCEENVAIVDFVQNHPY